MAATTLNSSEIRRSRIAYLIAKLRVRGQDYLLLNLHRKWGDWSLVGGHVEPEDLDFRAAALREGEEEMPPLRACRHFWIDEQPLALDEWGPVRSVSADGQPTLYQAAWFFLRFVGDPRRDLALLPHDEFRLVRVADVNACKEVSSVVRRVAARHEFFDELPLSSTTSFETPPFPVLEPASEPALRASR